MLKFFNRSFVAFLVLILLISLCACSASPPESAPAGYVKPSDSSKEDITIIALAPSLNETLVDLGFADNIIGYDFESEGIEGLNSSAEKFDIVNPDLEKITELAPDFVFTSGISLYDAENPYKPLEDAKITVVNVPTSQSIEQIKSDVMLIAETLNAADKGEELCAESDARLARIKETAGAIPEEERKSVYFEISAAPEMYSTGSGTYLNELIELIGAKNILDDIEGWTPVNGEAVAAADPDVILTNVNYIDDPVGEILSRVGFSGVAAVKNGDVYAVDNRASSLPNENIAKAAEQMAKAVYPEYFADL